MNLLYVRDFKPIEGKKFWRKYSLVGDFLGIKKTLWDTYPEIVEKVTKKEKVVKLDDKKYILKIVPKIDYYLSNNKTTYTVENMVKEFISLDTLNKKVYFTLKDYNDYIKEKVEALSLYQFKRFNLQPHQDLSDIQHLRIWPSLLLEDRDKALHRGAILANKPRSLIETLPLSRPIRITNFDRLPHYKKRKLLKLAGKRTTEPLKEGRFIPNFINPTYITIEYSPFIINEESYLNDLINFFEEYSKDWNMYRNDVTDIKNFAFHLITDMKIEKKRSRLDLLVYYIKSHKPKLFSLNLVRKIYNYNIITKSYSVNDGLYIIRKNNKLLHFIYSLKFDIIEYWVLPQGQNKGYIDSKKLINGYDKKNIYYFTINPQNSRLKRYLVVEFCKDLVSTNTRPIGNEQLERYKGGDNKRKVIKVFYVIKKVYYYSDEVMVDINFQTRTLQGTMRPKGLKKIYILK